MSAATKAVEDMARGYAVGRQERNSLPAATCLAMADAADELLRRHDAGDVRAIPHGDAQFVRGRVRGLREAAGPARGRGEYASRPTRPNFLPDGASDGLSSVDWRFVREFPGGPVAYFRQLGYSAKDAVKIAAMRLTHRNPQDAQEAFAGQGSRGEQIAGGRMDGMRSRVVQGDPGVPSAASGPRATDGSEGFPVTNPGGVGALARALEREWSKSHAPLYFDPHDLGRAQGAEIEFQIRTERGRFLPRLEIGFDDVSASEPLGSFATLKDASIAAAQAYFAEAREVRRNDGTSHAGATRSDVRSPTRTRTEVRSPTSTSTEVRSPTSTSTQAHTSGNVTVTGGAGAGAETHVTLVRPNPALILVAGNPRIPAEVERAWKTFHGRDEFTGTVRDVGKIPGAPDYAFALGRCVDVDFGRGAQTFSPRPWLVYAPDDEALWIVMERGYRLGSGVAGAELRSVTYAPQASSGKEVANYRHRFEAPRPTFSPVGNPNYCRAVLFDGGNYRVDDWIRD